MYKYKKNAEKAPNRRFHGVFYDSLIIVRGALNSALRLWEISGTPAPELRCRTPAAAGREPAEPAAEAAAGRARVSSPAAEKHKKKYSEKPAFFNILGGSSGDFLLFSYHYRIKKAGASAGLWEISGFLHIDSIYVYSLHFPIYGCIKACIKKTIREVLQILHFSEYVLCIHDDFYIKMEPKCMYIQCMFMHEDAETVAITGLDEIVRCWKCIKLRLECILYFCYHILEGRARVPLPRLAEPAEASFIEAAAEPHRMEVSK